MAVDPPEPSPDACLFAVGETVHVQSRTYPGINKPGGHGRVSKVHDGGVVDVRYFLGGSEKKVAPNLVTRYNPLEPSIQRVTKPAAEEAPTAKRAKHAKEECAAKKLPEEKSLVKITDPDCGDDGGGLKLRQRWGVHRTYVGRDCWSAACAALMPAGVALTARDVPHTGCCKGYSLVTLLRPEFDAPPVIDGGAAMMAGGSPRPTPPTRLALDAHVRRLRAGLSAALDEEELEALRAPANANRADWTAATSLADARTRVGLSYDAARAVGHSMSPVWLEEWETSRICAAEGIVCVELHDACPSNQGRSHFQVVGLPRPLAPGGGGGALHAATEVVVVKRMQCHYNPVWVNGRPRTTLGELPAAFRAFFGLFLEVDQQSP